LCHAAAALILFGTSVTGCGRGAPEAPPVVATQTALPATVPEPPAEPELVTDAQAVEDVEKALLDGFTAAIASRDIDSVAAWLAPELSAELRRLHDHNPAGFWERGSLWVRRASTGIDLAARQSNDGVDRWRGLVRFGDGFEESVIFGRFDGRVLLADL